MEKVVLCASSAYEEKYYLNEQFKQLPEAVKQELKIICVLYTAQVGGILTLEFEEDGHLVFHVTASEEDLFFDDIGSALKIKELQQTKRELLESLELYYAAGRLSGEDGL